MVFVSTTLETVYKIKHQTAGGEVKNTSKYGSNFQYHLDRSVLIKSCCLVELDGSTLYRTEIILSAVKIKKYFVSNYSVTLDRVFPSSRFDLPLQFCFYVNFMFWYKIVRENVAEYPTSDEK